jgi:hypothetical protein
MTPEQELSQIAGDYQTPEEWYHRKRDAPRTRRGREAGVAALLAKEFERLVKEEVPR